MVIENKMPIDLKKLWVVTWSKSQNCFHIETADEMLITNWDVFYHRNTNPSDWIVLAFADSHRKAQQAIQRLEKNMDNPKFGSTDVE